MQLPRAGLAVAIAATLCACGNANNLPPATNPSREDTVALWAATGTSILQPSAYDLVNNSVVRTDRSVSFDFVVDMVRDSAGDTVAVLVPRGGVGLSPDGGAQRLVARWDTVVTPPSDGYDAHAPARLDSTSVVVVRSRTQLCNFGVTAAFYAKVQALSINRVSRAIVLRILVNQNCGYRGLGPGIPTY